MTFRLQKEGATGPKALESLASSKLTQLTNTEEDGPTWTILGQPRKLSDGFYRLVLAWILINRTKYNSRLYGKSQHVYIFPGAAGKPYTSTSNLARRLYQTVQQVRDGALQRVIGGGDDALTAWDVDIEDLYRLWQYRGGDKEGILSLLDQVESSYDGYLKAKQERQDQTEESAQPEEQMEPAFSAPERRLTPPINTVIFGGHEDFVSRRYAPSLAKYGLRMVKNYPYKVRGRKDLTVPDGTDLILIINDMTAHGGSVGSDAAIALARKEGIPWMSVTRKVAQAVTALKDAGFIDGIPVEDEPATEPQASTPPAPEAKIVTPKDETAVRRPQAVARERTWAEWRNRRIEHIFTDPHTVSVEYEGVLYRTCLCPDFAEEEVQGDAGKLIVGYEENGGYQLLKKTSTTAKIRAAAQAAWDQAQSAPVEEVLPVVAPPAPPPVVERVVEKVVDRVVERVVEKVALHPYKDFEDLVGLLSEAMAKLNYGSVTVRADGSMVIERGPRSV